jgi:hypothetical protein
MGWIHAFPRFIEEHDVKSLGPFFFSFLFSANAFADPPSPPGSARVTNPKPYVTVLKTDASPRPMRHRPGSTGCAGSKQAKESVRKNRFPGIRTPSRLRRPCWVEPADSDRGAAGGRPLAFPSLCTESFSGTATSSCKPRTRSTPPRGLWRDFHMVFPAFIEAFGVIYSRATSTSEPTSWKRTSCRADGLGDIVLGANIFGQ